MIHLLALLLLGDIDFQDEGVSKGRVLNLDCRGSGVTCSRTGSTGTIYVGAYSGCASGEGLGPDGGCDALMPACSPNLGRYTDGGCIRGCTAPLEPCFAFDAGDWVGSGKWCLRGNGTMAPGSTVALYGINSPPTQSWPVSPGGGLETMTRLNDIPGGSSGWNQYFTTDGGQPTPPGSFTTCTVVANASLSNRLNAFVRYGSAGAIKWADVQSSSTFGDNVTCSPSCNGPSNNVVTPERAQVMHCAVFTAGDGGTGTGNTQSCTYIPGQGTTCSGTAHVQPRIGPVSTDVWTVGLSTSGTGTDEMLDGWHRGSWMTQSAYTVADMNRLGALIIQGSPAGETFTRLTNKTCCDSSNRCVNLPPNVPCVNGCVTEVSPTQVVNTDGTPEGIMSLGSFNAPLDGGSAIAVATADDRAGPFGFQTAVKYLFHETVVYASDAGAPYSWSESNATSCTLAVVDTGYLRCSWYVYGPATLDMCVANSPPTSTQPYGQQCSTCSAGAGWTLCSVSGRALASGTACMIGNLTQTAPTNSQPNNGTGLTTGTHVPRSAQTAWITMDQCNVSSDAPDYSSLGLYNARTPESCTGAGCP